MDNLHYEEELAGWLRLKPKIIKDLVAKYPPGMAIGIGDNQCLYVLGASEDGCVLVSTISPFEDYDLARQNGYHVRLEICEVCGNPKVGPCPEDRENALPAPCS